MALTRRHFLHSIAGAAGGLLAGRVFGERQPARQQVLRLGLVTSPAIGPLHRAILGAQFGLEEAAHAARLFGGAVELTRGSDAARLIEDDRVQVMIGGLHGSDCAELSDMARAKRVLFFNIGCEDDQLRGTRCSSTSYHIAMSGQMRRDARDAADAAAGEPEVLLWHPALKRFGAGQLNPRFHNRFGVAMDSDAWAAWMAVKIAAETFFRAKSAAASDLAEHLARPAARFDGHKGRPLSFRPWDHQLRQPLYVVPASSGGTTDTIVEVPVRGSGQGSVADQLDQLGGTAEETTCTWQAS